MNAATNEATVLQLKKFLNSGLSLEEACEALDIDEDAAKLYLNTENSRKVVSAEELVSKYKPLAVEALARYVLDPTEEWVPAKVAGAIFLAKGEGELPEFPIDKLSDMYKKMKEVVDREDVKVDDKTKSTYSLNNPSPATTVVEVGKKETKNPFGNIDAGMMKLN